MPPKRTRRRRKSVPCRNRLLCLLLSLVQRSAAIWKPCPSYTKLAKCFKKSEGAINRAFRALEQWEDCPLAFRSGYTGEGNTRQKLFAVKDNLLFDREPLFRRKDGRSRGIRESFRLDAEPLEEQPVEPEQETPQPDQSATESPDETAQKNPDIKAGSNCRFCFILEEETTSADKGDTPALPAAAGLSEMSLEMKQAWLEARAALDPTAPRPSPWPAGLSKRFAEREAWLAAEAALADPEIFYDNVKFVMPKASLRTLFLPAIRRGMEWRTGIRDAILHAVRQSHSASCLSEEIRNPGAFAATIFRERLGLEGRTRHRRRPDRSQPPGTGPQKIRDIPVSSPPVKALPPPAASVDRDAVRQQAGTLAAMMRAALKTA